MQNEIPRASIEYDEEIGNAPSASAYFFALFVAVLRRWKLIAGVTLFASIATYGVLQLLPASYISTVEILVFDPQQQLDAAVQKPISPFVDAVGFDAMNTEIKIIKSKSVALRVARELNLDRDPEFQPYNLLAVLGERLGFGRIGGADASDAQTAGDPEQDKAARLDQAADALLEKLQVWSEAYTISVSAASHNPVMAQRLAATIANDYLASQQEARQETLQRVATWLKGRVDDLQSRVSRTEAAIEKLKAESGVRDNVSETERRELNTQLMAVRAETEKRRADLDQARSVYSSNGNINGIVSVPNDIQSVPGLAVSPELTQLRQKRAELTWRVADLQNKLGEHHVQVINLRAQLDGIDKQLQTEEQHLLANMTNAYDVSLRQEKLLETRLNSMAVAANSDSYVKLQRLQHAADADHKLYQSYLSQYNDIVERRTTQTASARIISPATLPRTPSHSRHKLYALGGVAGLGGGLLLAFALEYFGAGVKTGTEIEQSFGCPVVGVIPAIQRRKSRGPLYDDLLQRLVDEPSSLFTEAVRAMRIGLELSSGERKVILVTSALPGEGKSTTAMLLAASTASAGRRTVLLGCDLHQPATAEAVQDRRRPGLSELLHGTAKLTDVIARDPVTKTYVIQAGSAVPNAADLLMSQRMRDLIAELRQVFDYIVMDTPPLLPIVDALPLATAADKILMIVEWGQTPRASISEALKMLRPQAHRVAGIVLNKVDLKQLGAYGGAYQYFSGA